VVNNKLETACMFTKRVECEIKATKMVCTDSFNKTTDEIIDREPKVTVEVIAQHLAVELSDLMFDHVTTMSTLLSKEAVRRHENAKKQGFVPKTVKDVQDKIYQPSLFPGEYPECEIDDEYGDVYFEEIETEEDDK
jgi:hypothetical protein